MHMTNMSDVDSFGVIFTSPTLIRWVVSVRQGFLRRYLRSQIYAIAILVDKAV